MRPRATTPTESDTAMTEPRICLFVDETMKDAHGDFHPVLVEEGRPGYNPTTYAFGPDLTLAQHLVSEANDARGIGHGDMLAIVESARAAEG